MSSADESNPTPLPDDFDAEAMRARYLAERDKRIRPEGNDQYVNVEGKFAHYLDDPYVGEPEERDVVTDEVEVVVIGGGFGGLQTAARLVQAGIEDLRIIEAGGDFGGTWYWNRYPGAQCDVESYIYLPLLEDLDYVPTEKYAYAKEILAHASAIGRHFGLYERTLFQTKVDELRWDDESERWIVSTSRGDRLRARFVTMSTGPLNRPKLPGIPGIEDFAGHTFHTSRWDYAYTGGTAEGNLEGLADKRVAVIGTGATGIQCVPHVGAAAKQLYVFQRTPSTVDVRGNAPTDANWAKSLESGWHKHRMENFNNLLSGIPQPEDLVNDGWTDLIGKTMNLAVRASEAGDGGEVDLPTLLETANFEKMEEIRARVDAFVDDPETAEKLKPYYKMFCKRPCFNDDYLPTFNRPNVELVDTDGKGVERITSKGLVVAGDEYEVDCIIFATGFEVGTEYSRRAGYETIGREGRTLTEHWKDGARTFHGLYAHGFPNCFILSQTQGGFTANFPHMLEELSTHIAHLIRHARDEGHTRVETTREAEAAWIGEIVDKSMVATGVIGSPDCTPGYYNNEGQDNPQAQQNSPYGGGSTEFFARLAEWREAGGFEGLTFDR
ncbi:MAG: NAD(P)/FAD-dependent oxidoreductase [Myxococcota bacterium]